MGFNNHVGSISAYLLFSTYARCSTRKTIRCKDVEVCSKWPLYHEQEQDFPS